MGKRNSGWTENPLFSSSGAFWSEELPAALKPSWGPGGRESVLRKNEPGEACEGQRGPRAAAQGFGRLTIHGSHGRPMGSLDGPMAGPLHLNPGSQNVPRRPPPCASPSGTGKDRALTQVHGVPSARAETGSESLCVPS